MDLNTLAHAPDVLNTPPMVFITNAMPLPDKRWWDYLIAAAPLATAFVAIQQWLLSRKQHEIQRNQLKLSGEQKKISVTQKEIARGKLKLEVFEKRYELYKQFKDKLNEFIIKMHKASYEELSHLHDELMSLSYEFSFLYNENVSINIDRSINDCLQIIENKRKFKNHDANDDQFRDSLKSKITDVIRFYALTFPKLVKPFLNLEELDRL